VVDISEVANHFAFIEDGNRFARENAPREFEERHIRPSPWSIYGKESEARAWQSIEMGVCVGHQLVGFFRRCIKRYGMIDVVMLGKRLMGVRAVNRAR